jgi:acyl-CoA synthetase (NDP forming)
LFLVVAGARGAPPRVGVISNSGASCVLAADACDAQGLALADFSAATRQLLDALLPDFSRSRNPVDLTAMLLADSSMLGHTIATVLADPACDALALSLLAVAGAGYDIERFAQDTARALRRQPKPMVFISPHARVRAAFAAQGLAVFMSEPDAIAAIKDHHAHRRLMAGPA